MDNLINVDHFKMTFYKAFLPLDQINSFLSKFTPKEVEAVTKVLISIFDTEIVKTLLENFDSTEQKQQFLRLLESKESSETIMNFLIDTFPGSEALITETLERTLLSASSAIK
jgi:hypothetical protein